MWISQEDNPQSQERNILKEIENVLEPQHFSHVSSVLSSQPYGGPVGRVATATCTEVQFSYLGQDSENKSKGKGIHAGHGSKGS